MSVSSKTIDSLLTFDPLAHAEKITGESCHGDDRTLALGFAMNMAHAAIKENALKANNDTCFQNTVEDYLAIAEDIGFRVVLKLPFINKTYEHPDTFYVLFDDKRGILLMFDTFMVKDVNGGTFHFDWKPNSEKREWPSQCSGGYDKEGKILSGYFDCREGLRHHIRMLDESGTFVTPWKADRHLWMCHHGDTARHESYSAEASEYYKEQRQKRLAMLPPEVRYGIGLLRPAHELTHEEFMSLTPEENAAYPDCGELCSTHWNYHWSCLHAHVQQGSKLSDRVWESLAPELQRHLTAVAVERA
jgi:hypothetical protein